MKQRIIIGLAMAAMGSVAFGATTATNAPQQSTSAFSPTLSALQNFYAEIKTGPSVSSDNTKFEPDTGSGHNAMWIVPDNGFNDASMGTEPLYGAVLGYQLNPNIGFDVDYIYRTHFSWSQQYSFTSENPSLSREKVIDNISVQTWMLNTNFSPITWNHFTPYVSIGAGLAVNKTYGMRNIDLDTRGLANRLDGETDENFSWQAGLGFNYWMSPNWKLDLAYHFRDIGEIETGHNDTMSGNTIDPFKAKHVHLNEFSLGLGYQI